MAHLLAVCLATLALGVQPNSPDLLAVIKTAKPSVVTVMTRGSKGEPRGQGSGFFVAPGLVATCCHVLDGAYSVRVLCPDGTEAESIGVVSESREADLALISLEAETGVLLRLAPRQPIEGERVVVVGCPEGLAFTATDGIVSALRPDAPLSERIQVSAPVSHGSSGSPVLNTAGEVLGIVSATNANGQSLNFAIPALEVRNLLARKPASQFPKERVLGLPFRARAERIVRDDFKAARKFVIEAEARQAARERDSSAFSGDDERIRAAEQGETESAERRIELATRFAPDDAELWEYLGRARGLVFNRTAFDGDPNAAEIRAKAGRVVEPFERSLALDPDRSKVWRELRTWYMWSGRAADVNRAADEERAASDRSYQKLMDRAKMDGVVK